MEHVFPGFSRIIPDNAIKDCLFDGIFYISDGFAGWELECFHDFFSADRRLEIPDGILLFNLFQFLAHDLEVCQKAAYFLLIFGGDVRFCESHQVVDIVTRIKKQAAYG